MPGQTHDSHGITGTTDTCARLCGRCVLLSTCVLSVHVCVLAYGTYMWT